VVTKSKFNSVEIYKSCYLFVHTILSGHQWLLLEADDDMDICVRVILCFYLYIFSDSGIRYVESFSGDTEYAL